MGGKQRQLQPEKRLRSACPPKACDCAGRRGADLLLSTKCPREISCTLNCCHLSCLSHNTLPRPPLSFIFILLSYTTHLFSLTRMILHSPPLFFHLCLFATQPTFPLIYRNGIYFTFYIYRPDDEEESNFDLQAKEFSIWSWHMM